jgi:MOSC domain-containing protein YiiM
MNRYLFGKKNSAMKVESLALSKKKGTRKTLVPEVILIENFGIDGDAHAGDWHRQVSFLSAESILDAEKRGLEVTFGDFAENIATTGIDWLQIPVGTIVSVGDQVVVEITQIGKECHRKCAIYHMAGDCIMPREGVFGRVLQGGKVKCGDRMHLTFPGKGENGDNQNDSVEEES